MKAVILSAGYGTRLRPLTNHIAKPMVKVLGIPVIEYTLNFLKISGIKDVYINRHYFPEQFNSIKVPSGINIHFSVEEEILGTLGGLLSFKDNLLDDDFLVVNGDIIFDFDLKQAYHLHRSKGNVATMVLREKDLVNVSSVNVDDFSNVVKIGKRSDDVYREYMFSGIHIISPDFFVKLGATPQSPSCLVKDFYIPYLNDGGRVSAFVQKENFLWMELGDLSSYLKANINILNLLSRYKLDHELESFISGYWFNSRDQRIVESIEGVWLGEGYYIDHDSMIIPPVVIGSGAKIMGGTTVGPNAIIGDGVEVLEGAEVKESLILDGSKIKTSSFVEKMIVSPDFIFNAQEGTIN